MFYYLEGIITVVEQNMAVVDIGGVGYCCFTTVNTLSKIEKGKKARLYIYNDIKEDAFNLYGFADEREKRSFELLLSVSGVGPKAALAILSATSAEGLAMAIVSENEKALTAAPGIGKKIAQRIILELKDKIQKENSAVSFIPVQSTVSTAGAGQKLADVSAALTVLGYSPAEINAALKVMDLNEYSVEDAIRIVLKNSVK